MRRSAAAALVWMGCLFVAVASPAVASSSRPTVMDGPQGARVTTTDVIVYGATPAGITAAIAATRQGARVILLEPTRHIGGMMTSGLGASDIGSKEAIGGIARDFFLRLGVAYHVPDGLPSWQMTPSTAEHVFTTMLAQAHVGLLTGQRLRERNGVLVTNHRIEQVTTETARTFAARVFVDATYEGDLMAQAGVSFTVGRESYGQYGESLAGVRPPQPELPAMLGTVANGVSAPGISTSAMGEVGSADRHIQPYTFRLCVSSDPANQVPFPRPAGYDAARFVLVQRHLASFAAAGQTVGLARVVTIAPLPERKGDLNAAGPLSTDLLGGSDAYPTATYTQRQAIWQAHYQYEAGLLYFLANDPSVPPTVRSQLRAWGLCRDEFTDSHNWPSGLYVREARRMVSDFVMTEPDLVDQRRKPDAIAVGSYRFDAHPTRLVLGQNDTLQFEGRLADPIGGRYEIPYRILVPQRSQILNLLDPVTVSASHVAFASLRVEPQYMAMGEAAGTAAGMTARTGAPVQDVDVAKLQSGLSSRAAAFHIGTTLTQVDTRQASASSSPPARASGVFMDLMLVALMLIGVLAAALRWRDRLRVAPAASLLPSASVHVPPFHAAQAAHEDDTRTLHGAMVEVLRGSSRLPAREIANQINRQRLYQRGDGRPLGDRQVLAQAHKHPDLFDINRGGVALIG